MLRLEQALTTGGGCRTRSAASVDGVKVVTAEAGLVPDTRIHYVPADVLDPAANGGPTLLYYTGITRVAKNILQQVVGRYLDRDRQAMATLRQTHALPPQLADAMARKDLPAFGRLIDLAWRLNKQLDPNSSTPQIEAMLDRAVPARPRCQAARCRRRGIPAAGVQIPRRRRGHAERTSGQPAQPAGQVLRFRHQPRRPGRHRLLTASPRGRTEPSSAPVTSRRCPPRPVRRSGGTPACRLPGLGGLACGHVQEAVDELVHRPPPSPVRAMVRSPLWRACFRAASTLGLLPDVVIAKATSPARGRWPGVGGRRRTRRSSRWPGRSGWRCCWTVPRPSAPASR